jgi:hypothetical protein
MKSITAVISIVVSLILLSPSRFACGQSISSSVTFTSNVKDDSVTMKPKVVVEINREPIPILQLATELVEILPGETRPLTSTANIGSFPWLSALRAGATLGGALAVKAGVSISYRLKVARLDRDGLTLDITITDNSNRVLATRVLSLRNYEEGMIEFASAENGDKRLAFRLLPTIKIIPPVQEFPALLRSFTLSGLLIRNGDELVSRGAVFSSTLDDLTGKKQPFFTFNSQRSGFLVMSYRPFPGAVVAGYFEDKKIVFEWNGDTYEYFSLDKPFLPEGKWAAYFWQASPAPPAPATGMGIGAFEADPAELAAKVSQMVEMINSVRPDKGAGGMSITIGPEGVTLRGK